MFPFPSDRTGNRKFQKKRRKFKKIKKYICGFISSQNRMGKAQREKRKIIVSFRSELTGNRKFQKNSKIIQKIQKYHYDFISGQKSMEKVEKEIK